MPDEIWGTFSVEDADRRRAFVADVLLYDRLVIPFPADEETRKLWSARGHDLDGLSEKILILARHNLVKAVPWTEAKTAQFRHRLEADQALQDEPGLRQFLMDATYKDWVAYGATRSVLADEARLYLGWSQRPAGTYVEAVAAYPSHGAFARDFQPALARGAPAQHAARASSGARSYQLAGVFGWELFIPDDPRLTDNELLLRAADLAARDELREKRREFHQWRRMQVTRRVPDEEALADGRRRLEAYRLATAATKTRTRAMNAFTVFGIAGSIVSAALAFPPAGVGAAIFTAARFAVEQRGRYGGPDSEARAFAMFYDAQRHFGWKSPD